MKKSAGLLMLIFLNLPTDASADSCLIGDCKNGLSLEYADPFLGPPILYLGDFADRKKSGCATIMQDGVQYFGQVVDGKKEGLGIEYDTKKMRVRLGRWQSDRLTEELEQLGRENLCEIPVFP